MADTHDFLALDWVKGEIEETLKQAQQALEAHVENPEDQTRLRFCLTYLHQVYGTLQMVEFYGAALLAEEMEHLTQAMISGKVSRLADAQETLMRGMLQLPAYLDRIKASRRDLPMVLMPLLNDIRAARGEKLLSEGALFKPDMAQASGSGEVSRAVAADPNLAELLRKIRQMFQLALLGFIRGENLPTNVGYMSKVAAKLEKISGDAPISPLWKVVGAVTEGIGNESIAGNTAVKLLLGHVDRQLKVLVEQGAVAFAEKPAEDLFKNLLFYVARSPAQSRLITEVRKTYKLDEALPSEDAIDEERAKMSGPDRQTMASVARAISEELARVKEALDIFMRGGEHSKVQDLAAHLPTLKQVSDTIAMLGLGQQRKLILEQHEILAGMIAAGKIADPAALMDVAGALLYVEATLASETDRPGAAVPSSPQDALTQDEIHRANIAVVHECRAGLETTKEKIVEYIASQWDRTHIQDLPDILTAVRGGLQIISLDRPAEVLSQSVNFVRRELLADDAQPDWKRMDMLADAISSVEYYLERVVDDPQGGEHILEIAEKSVADLGFPVRKLAKPVGQVPDEIIEVVSAEVAVSEDFSLDEIPTIEMLPVDEFSNEIARSDAFADGGLTDDEELVVAALDDEPAMPDDELVDMVDALPRVGGVEVLDAGADTFDEASAETPLLGSDFSLELDDAPTLDVPMTAAAEHKHSFVDEEIPLVDDEALALSLPQESDALQMAGDALFEDVMPDALDDALMEDLPDTGQVDERDLRLRSSDALLETELHAVTEDAAQMVYEDIVADAADEFAVPATAPAATAPADDGETEEAAVDEEIVEIFVEEIAEVMTHLDEYFPQWVANQQDESALREFRRGFHTLKGSGRMVGAKYVGELAWSIENMLNRVIDNTVVPTPVMIELIRTVRNIAPELVEAFASRRKPPYVVEPLMDCANAFARGEQPAAVPPLQVRGAPPPAAEAVVQLVDGLPVMDVADEAIPVASVSFAGADFADDLPAHDEVSAADVHAAEAGDDFTAMLEDHGGVPQEISGDDTIAVELPDAFVLADVAQVDELPVADDMDADIPVADQVIEYSAEDMLPDDGDIPMADVVLEDGDGDGAVDSGQPAHDLVLLEVFSTESGQHLAVIDDYLASLDPDITHHPITDELLRALHTLKGSARMAGIMPVSEIAGPTEKFCKDLRNNGETADTDVIALVREAAALIRLRIERLLPDPYAPIPGAQAYLEMLEAIQSAQADARLASEMAEQQPVLRAVQPRPGLINDLLAEGLDHVLDGGDYAAQWSQQGVVADDLAAMLGELRRLAVAAERGGITPMHAVAQRLRRVYNGIQEGKVMLASQVLAALQQGHEAIIAMMDCMAAHQSIWPATEAEVALDAISADLPPIDAPELPAEPAMRDADEFDADTLFSADEMEASEAEVIELTGSVEPEADVETAAGVQDVELSLDDVQAAGQEVVAQTGTAGPDYQQPEAIEVEAALPQGIDDEFAEIDEATLALGVADGMVAEEPELMPELPASVPVPTSQRAEVSQHAAQRVPVEDESEYAEDIADRDPELVEIFLEEAGEIVESSAESLETWLSNPDDLLEVQKLQRDLHTLKGGARMAEFSALGDLAHELENLYEGLSQGSLHAQPSLFALLNRCHDRIADMVQDIRSSGRCKKGTALINAIHAYIKDPVGFTDEAPTAVAPVAATEEAPAPTITAESVDYVAADSDVQIPDESVAAAASATDVAVPLSAPVPVAAVAAAPVAEEALPVVDADILEIFLEEAADLTAELDEALVAWKADPGNGIHADQLKRVLHTMKGGARLAGLKRLGDLSHDFETRLIDLGPRTPDEAFFAAVMTYHDEIGSQVERVRAGGAAAAAAANAEAMAKASAAVQQAMPAAEAAPVSAPPVSHEPQVAPVAAADVAQASVPAAAAAAAAPRRDDATTDHRRAPTQTAARQAQPQEMVKVPSDLLEKLVNLAGETSINRGRIETQVTDFRFTLNEMASTISRLAEQLRRLDAEADAQVKANWEKGVAEGKYQGDFDPLEMDQYSGLHQLTKQLFESASDLLDIRDTLVNKSRDTETLLLQQSRVNTELQEGLMRSRMVPFSRLIPRLRRIVRQVAGELKKNIDIDFINPEGEMDRTLLERIVAPLEHMLRNACDHGVEDPQTRAAAGKPAQGRIRLALSREGGEVVLRISDDGKGIDVNVIRRKAMERGLMDETSELSEQDIMQFILEAGFSTAEKVTQISGRGVGMDVVSSEIKQMGGALMIQSEVGKGTTFEIRLPFTVSVNRALMVRVGDENYAIPLVQIEGIVRVSPYELETYYQPDAPPFEYAGEKYRLNYLGGFMHGVAAPDLHGVIMPLPVLLVRGSEHTVAVQVDQLIGSREVVVKAVGPQLSTVAGISGATILGDGRVVIILDLLSLIRASHLQHEMLQAQQRRLAAQQADARGETIVRAVREVPLIMVTDDSVTVRKVTGRFLERQGFEVVTAKDGMDAVAQLADIKPDLMLLDIEMPRMDGFEVASHCRHDSRLKDLPIIMITSRTGEKHRERAFEIGVNAYLGKPFQESELLAKIQELLAERRAKAQH